MLVENLSPERLPVLFDTLTIPLKCGAGIEASEIRRLYGGVRRHRVLEL
jgi:hypothetical protein